MHKQPMSAGLYLALWLLQHSHVPEREDPVGFENRRGLDDDDDDDDGWDDGWEEDEEEEDAELEEDER